MLWIYFLKTESKLNFGLLHTPNVDIQHTWSDCLCPGKIEARKMKERNGATAHRHQSAIEDFCDTFERTVKPVVVCILLSKGQYTLAVCTASVYRT